MNFFHHKDLGNHLLQLCPKVVKHPVYLCLQIPGSVPVLPVGVTTKRRYSDEQHYDYGRQCVVNIPSGGKLTRFSMFRQRKQLIYDNFVFVRKYSKEFLKDLHGASMEKGETLNILDSQ